MSQHDMPPGQDTPTGTDPDAAYVEPGYEDKSFGQAVDADRELAERIAAEEPDEETASERFDEEATGSPAIQRQRGDAEDD